MGPSQGLLQTEHLKHVNVYLKGNQSNTLRNKAQIKFIDMKMEPLGLLAKFLARNPGNIYFHQTKCGIRILPKR